MGEETRPVAAALSALAAMALIAWIDGLVVRVAEVAGLWQFHALRAAVALPLIALGARIAGQRVLPRRPWPVALRSLLLAGSMLLYFGALAFIPVSQAAAGLFTAPIFMLLISAAVFGLRPGWRRVAAVVVGFAGVVMVLRPGGAGTSPAVLMPLGAAVLYALAGLATRRWCAGEGTAPLLAGFFAALGALGALGCVVLALWQPPAPPGAEGFLMRGWVTPDAALAAWIFGLALGAVVGVALITRAYVLGEASFVAGFEYSLMIFAALWGWLLWEQTVTPLAAAGMALILTSGVFLMAAARRGAAVPAVVAERAGTAP